MESQRKIQTWKIKQIVTHAVSLCLSIEMEFLERIWPTDQPEMGKQAVKHTTIEWTIECKGERVIQRITYRKWRKFVVFFFLIFSAVFIRRRKIYDGKRLDLVCMCILLAVARLVPSLKWWKTVNSHLLFSHLGALSLAHFSFEKQKLINLTDVMRFAE